MKLDRPHPLLRLTAALAAAAVGGCGSGSQSAASLAPSTAPVQVSASGLLPAGCGLATVAGETVNSGSAIQPQIAANAATPAQLAGVWQEDRWTGLGARAIMSAWSGDGGLSWSVPQPLAFSVCGTSAAPAAVYDRASDPWISFGRNGTVYASALAFSAAGYLAPGGTSAVLVSASANAGAAWNTPAALISDASAANSTGPYYFNDRDSVTADPASDAAYVVWDRITSDAQASIPTWLGRTQDGGAHWTTSVLYDPGLGLQTFNNQIVILPDGSLLDFFTLFTSALSTSLQVVRSSDQGLTWSAAPVKVADMQSVGTTNPITQGSIRDSALMAQTAVDPASRTIAVVWQQNFPQAGVTVANDGIALSLSTDGGKTWSASPLQINDVKTVAAFSPTVRFLPGGVLAVTYYDLRDYQAGSTQLLTDLWLAESADHGASWHELRVFGPFDMNKAPLTDLNPTVSATALFLGDNQGLAASASTLVPFFAATDAVGARVYAAHPADALSSPQARVYTAAVPRSRSMTATAVRRAQKVAAAIAARRLPHPSQQVHPRQ